MKVDISAPEFLEKLRQIIDIPKRVQRVHVYVSDKGVEITFHGPAQKAEDNDE